MSPACAVACWLAAVPAALPVVAVAAGAGAGGAGALLNSAVQAAGAAATGEANDCGGGSRPPTLPAGGESTAGTSLEMRSAPGEKLKKFAWVVFAGADEAALGRSLRSLGVSSDDSFASSGSTYHFFSTYLSLMNSRTSSTLVPSGSGNSFLFHFPSQLFADFSLPPCARRSTSASVHCDMAMPLILCPNSRCTPPQAWHTKVLKLRQM
mmetsp:Transcript_31269/g.79627  ORF Transcript_31269/g.79627 Transcript_31269/m.79627 type:complete len:209 (+) Transcript_31269:306-932(+)